MNIPLNNWKKRLNFLKREYHQIKALNDISLSVNEGEILGILGPTGAGKTTMIKIIAGLLLPEKGNATINGYNIFKDREKVRTSVNILMSGGWVVFDYKLSIYFNLKYWGLFGGVSHNEIDDRIDNVLKTVGLYDKKHEFPERLSAGMRQKLNLARCLLTKRPLYLLDEPTSNIDPFTAHFIRKFIREVIKNEKRTAIIATHNLWEAEEVCDKIAILHQGKILVLDKVANIIQKMGQEVITLELEKISDDLIKNIKTLNYVENITQEENKLKVYGSIKKNVPDLIESCQKHTTILNVEIDESSLNEIFINLIEKEKKT